MTVLTSFALLSVLYELFKICIFVYIWTSFTLHFSFYVLTESCLIYVLYCFYFLYVIKLLLLLLHQEILQIFSGEKRFIWRQSVYKHQYQIVDGRKYGTLNTPTNIWSSQTTNLQCWHFLLWVISNQCWSVLLENSQQRLLPNGPEELHSTPLHPI